MRNQEDERLDQLLATRDYQELSDQEKLWVNDEVGGEASYRRMRQLLLAVRGEVTLQVNPSVRQSLIKKINDMHEPAWSRMFTYRMPAYAVALCSLIVGIVTYFTLPRQEVIVEKPVLAAVPEPTIVTRHTTDTVFVDRIVRVPVYLKVAEKRDDREPQEREPELPGKSLAQQVELRSLLVRSE